MDFGFYRDKRVLIVVLPIVAILTTLFVITAVSNFDLTVSNAIVSIDYMNTRYSYDVYGRIIEVIGEMPVYLIGTFCIFGLEYCIRDLKCINKKVIVMVQIIAFIGAICVGAFMYHRICKYMYIFIHDGTDDTWCKFVSLSLLVTIPLALLQCFGIYKLVNRLLLDKVLLFRLVIVSGLALGLTLIATESIKHFISRTRYRALLYLDHNTDNFTRWWQKGSKSTSELAIKDDFKSFPSGHSNAANSTLFFALVPYYFGKNFSKVKNILMMVLPFVYITIVMVGRVVMGAHYVSDVTFASLMTFIVFVSIFEIVELIYDKKFKKGIATEM